jgi:hypothetical protein
MPDENWLDTFSVDMFQISVGAHSCAMHSRLKAAPTVKLSEREMLRLSWARTYAREVTVVLGVNWRITNKQKTLFGG